MRCLVLLFIFTFSPLAFNVSGSIGKLEIDKLQELGNSEPVLKTAKDELIEVFSEWKIAEASYYDPKDSNQTKKDCDGIGALERTIGSGSISLGSSFTEIIRKEGMQVFIQVKDFNVMTPYGKGIFRVDDIMANRYNKSDKFHIDFFHEDLSLKHKRQGRFKIMFKIIKIQMADSHQPFFLFGRGPTSTKNLTLIYQEINFLK